jgi:sugar lactone lactonase YvrE
MRINLLRMIALACCLVSSTASADQRVVTDPVAIAQTVLAAASAGPAARARDAKLEPVAMFPDTMPAGVAISRGGRIFVSFPRWTDQVQFSLGEITKDGGLVGFPNGDGALRSVQGITIDDRDRLWLLDAGTGKLTAYDLPRENARVKSIDLTAGDALRPGSYLNDVRVDPSRGAEGFAYISDSAAGGVIVVDLASGAAWRRLDGATSAHASEDFVAEVEGEPLMHRPAGGGNATPMRGHTDGIALSPDGKVLYYSALGRREIWGVSCDALADRNATEQQVEATAKKIAVKTSGNDGLICDEQGRIYSTDFEDNSIRRWTPADDAKQKGELIVQDERLLWPDAMWIHGGYLYVTSNQLHRLPGYHQGRDVRQPPYALFRYPLSK